ncbi:hypothetical protein [Snodgrassella alvi]|uniref:hypothetical protein n=1 Tax=Snodgrassella alvi TaxID=1196083 RepID=UPI00117B60AF|nr:hypothetical protein [Snodgrassella alvi]
MTDNTANNFIVRFDCLNSVPVVCFKQWTMAKGFLPTVHTACQSICLMLASMEVGFLRVIMKGY